MKIPIILAIIGIGIIIGISLTYSSESNNVSVGDDVSIQDDVAIQSDDTDRGDVSIQSHIPIEYDETITVGTIHRDAVKMTKRYQPFIDYVAEKLSDEDTTYKGVVQIVASEQEMVNKVISKELDLFFDSPLIGMKVAKQTEMSPLLLSWKEGFREYHSVFIVPIESELTFDDLNGKTIIFEDEESTSGYLLPLTHLQNSGYIISNSPENITPVFSLDDENTPIWLLEGRGDIGATSNLDFEDIPINIKEKVKIITKTDSIPRQIIFIGNHVENQDNLKTILLEMNVDVKALKIIEKISHTTKFSEIDEEKDLEPVREILESLK